MKGKKGQSIFGGIQIFIMVFLALVALIPTIKDVITTARDASHLDCDNDAISIGTKGTCLLVDFTMFYFVGMTMAAAMGYITGRKFGMW